MPDPGQVWQHSFEEIAHEIFSSHSHPSTADSRRAVFSF